MPFSLALIITYPILTALVALTLHRRHLLMTLLYLELMLLALTLMFIMNSTNLSFFFLLMVMTMGASAASLGLALMVTMSRHFGSDFLINLTSNKC